MPNATSDLHHNLNKIPESRVYQNHNYDLQLQKLPNSQTDQNQN